MKHKNGFTLIELIGIIVILGVLVAIGVPSLIKTLNNNKNKEYETFEKNLFLATESYVQKHQNSFTSLAEPNGSAIVGINTLVDVGLIKSSMVNPKTGEKINLNDFIKVTNTKDQEQDAPHYNYQYLVADKLESWEYAYREDYQQFTAKKTGHYKLEVWGAQGGSVTDDSGKLYEGGYGAYASGIVELSNNDTLYIFTGGMGSNQNDDPNDMIMGGYNGGGAAYNTTDNLVASGGGATHISQIDRSLSSYNDDEYELLANEALIVAAGGGGAFKGLTNQNFSANGGSGGGIDGSIPWNVSLGDNEDNACIYPKDIKEFLDAINPNHGLNISNNFGSYCSSSGIDTNLLNIMMELSAHFGNGSVKFTDDYGNDFDENEHIRNLIDIAYENNSSISGGGGGIIGGGLGYNIGGNGGLSYVTHSNLQDRYIACYKCDTNDAGFTYNVDKVSNDPLSNSAKKGNGYAKITYLDF
ncbi:MAG: glycine-rich protein [Bacilli bacterium]